jgi:transcriptional regulator with XRE-family HTH domain
MIRIFPSDFGALARRLRDEVGIGVRTLASELDVTYSAVARAERGEIALASLAERAVHHLVGRLVEAPEGETPMAASLVEEPGTRFDGPAAEHLVRLLAIERGWRRALVRGVMEEHQLEVETEGARAAVHFLDDNGNRRTLRFDLDRGTFELDGQRYRAVETSPYERADRETWGASLELLAAVHSPLGAGWTERAVDGEATITSWLITDGAEPSDDPHPLI